MLQHGLENSSVAARMKKSMALGIVPIENSIRPFSQSIKAKVPRETEDGRLSAVSQIRWPAYHSRTNNKPGPDPAADLDPRPNYAARRS